MYAKDVETMGKRRTRGTTTNRWSDAYDRDGKEDAARSQAARHAEQGDAENERQDPQAEFRNPQPLGRSMNRSHWLQFHLGRE
jgi:hypothetical protein